MSDGTLADKLRKVGADPALASYRIDAEELRHLLYMAADAVDQLLVLKPHWPFERDTMLETGPKDLEDNNDG